MSANAAADRNLLFGILALQMDFISRDQLVAAMNAWVLEKAKPLGQILIEQGALDGDNRAWLDAGVEKHLAKHNNDPSFYCRRLLTGPIAPVPMASRLPACPNLFRGRVLMANRS